MFPALQVMRINHGYWLSFCTTAPLTNTSPGRPQRTTALGAQELNREMRLKHSWSAERGKLLTAPAHCCMIQWLTHCFFDSGWYSTGCSPLYLWAHYQRAAAQPWQSNWCFGMRVGERWAPPLGRGLVEAAHTPVAWIPNIQQALLFVTMNYSAVGNPMEVLLKGKNI